ncbi:hypothetical protein TOT_040000800 [Theileria orientalis strain Shintoku]|uniref:Uncharacterized protein n=1 Tax=Theileria orientalis strain Shintoku TaxID=869250 RepID=J7M8M8_THEOR|nr:hypothetical protein TOT_040000800 [Theileria orientalis strain Shintoku]BAM42433.1 hypothetical protein TOT_040000800 [Theileria orientalis strain Shintoku]|eukprot:XP_009692734.1 hypothetical protein TOT_040000800 [Theileria orientalis strain Shintoku]
MTNVLLDMALLRDLIGESVELTATVQIAICGLSKS